MKAHNMMRTRNLAIAILATGGFALASAAAQAGPGQSGHGHGTNPHMPAQGGDMGHDMPGGMPGELKNVSRTIVIIAKDTEFNLKRIQVKDGETIRFIVKNEGELVHEMTIGTPQVQKGHQAEMMKMMEAGHLTADKMTGDMEHSHGNSALVEPGKQAEVIWMFHKGVKLEFGCNVPGHYEQGMKGSFDVT